MTSPWLVLLPREAMEVIDLSYGWGQLTCRLSVPDRTALVMAISNEDSDRVKLNEAPDHFLTVADWYPSGYWYRVDERAVFLAWQLRVQNLRFPFEGFQSIVPSVHRPDPGNWHLVVAYCEEPPELREGARLPQWSAWRVTHDYVEPALLDTQSGSELVESLEGLWPAKLLGSRRALVVGTGSIGAAAAEALASYGVGQMDLVDPDRLLFHNVPRHVLGRGDVGKMKVDALHEHLARAWPEAETHPLALDVIENADIIRPLLDVVDIVVCTVDGIEARRVVSHLARRARKSVVFACVLGDGQYGEVLRIRALPEVGCLDCQRRHLRDSGQMDPEPTLDRGYGEGTRHNPMTAVGGDLHLIGSMAAKAAIATLLRQAGEPGQALEDDNLVIALRPSGAFGPPFDARRTMNTRWYAATGPYDDCPSCRRREAPAAEDQPSGA